MRILRTILLAAFLAGFFACDNTKQLVVTTSNQDEVVQKVAKSKKLTDEEKRLFGSALMREGMAKALGQAFGSSTSTTSTMMGKTVAQIIDDQRTIEKEEREREAREKRLAEEARQREAARLKKLWESILITPFSLKEVERGFMTAEEIKYAVENLSGRDIRAFEGTMKFRDVLGHDVDDGHVKVTELLKAGEKRTITDHEFMTSLRGKKLEELKVEWVPDAILFADGERVDREEPNR
jgi:hypothetical protein